MTILLHCERCGGNIRPYKYCGYRICDVDGEKLTEECRQAIKYHGCSFFTLRSIPRKETSRGAHQVGISDTLYQTMVNIPSTVVNMDTKRDDGKLIPFEYEGVI
jgi:hypothetical protein